MLAIVDSEMRMITPSLKDLTNIFRGIGKLKFTYCFLYKAFLNSQLKLLLLSFIFLKPLCYLNGTYGHPEYYLILYMPHYKFVCIIPPASYACHIVTFIQ